jgi:hypothetical protein
MDLYVWKRPVLDDTAEAKRLLELDDESVFERSEDLVAFFAELSDRLPFREVSEMRSRPTADTPWADPPEASDRLVSLSIRWGAADGLDTIVELARRFDLVLYDPQGPSFHSPAWEGEPVAPGVGEFLRGGLVLAAGLLVAIGGWMLSLPVLSWVLTLAGGFVVLVALLSIGAIAHEAWRIRVTRPR